MQFLGFAATIKSELSISVVRTTREKDKRVEV